MGLNWRTLSARRWIIVFFVQVPLLLLCAAPPAAYAAAVGHVPFELNVNRVVLPITVGDSRELIVTLDTGMRSKGVYLFHKELNELLDPARTNKVRVGGAGSGEASYALMADSMTISIGEATATDQMVIVSQSSITQGFSTDGVIGYSLFGAYVVEIDYDTNVLRLHHTEDFAPDSTWLRIPIELQELIPFLSATVSVTGEPLVPIRVYIDLAAADALSLLVRPDMKVSIPDELTEKTYLGTGLSGDIYGRVGRISRLDIGPFVFGDVRTNFPPAEVRSKQEGADGILGNDAIRRFNVIFDYSKSVMYVKANRYTKEPFE